MEVSQALTDWLYSTMASSSAMRVCALLDEHVVHAVGTHPVLETVRRSLSDASIVDLMDGLGFAPTPSSVDEFRAGGGQADEPVAEVSVKQIARLDPGFARVLSEIEQDCGRPLGSGFFLIGNMFIVDSISVVVADADRVPVAVAVYQS